MKSKDEVLTLLRREKPKLRARFPIGRLALFGSVARGEAGPQSDVDILVEFNGPIGWNIVDLADALEQLLGERVDLFSWRSIRPEVWPLIASEVIDA